LNRFFRRVYPAGMGGLRRDLLPAAAILFFVALAFGQLLGPRPLAGHDVLFYSLPNRVQVTEALRRGHLPTWDPYRFGGVPLLASPPAAVLYPPTWILLPMAPDTAQEVSRFLHIFLAALGAYAFATRALGTSRLSGVLAGIALSLGGFVHAHLGHIEQVSSLAWLPWALLAADRAIGADRWRNALRPVALLAFTLALCGLAGHTQYLHMGIALVAVYSTATARPLSRSLRPLAGVALGLGLSAAQLLPAWHLSRHSMRAGGLSFSAAAEVSLPWSKAVAALLPDYFGPVRLGVVEFWSWLPWSVLTLAGIALARKEPGRRVWALGALALLGWLLALGPGTPLFRAAYELVPGAKNFRVPARWLLFPTLTLPLLAAVGLDAVILRSRLSRAKLLLPLAAVALLAVGVLRGDGVPRTSSLAAGAIAAGVVLVLRFAVLRKERLAPAAGLALLAVAAVELLAANRHTYARTLRIDRGVILPPSNTARALDDPTGGRVLPIGSEEPGDFDALRRALRPNTFVFDGLRSIDGYDSGLLIDPHWVRAMTALTGRKEFEPMAALRGNLNPPYAGRLDPERFAELDVTRAVVRRSAMDIVALLPPGSRHLRRVGDVDVWATPSRGAAFLADGSAAEGLRLVRDPREPERLEAVLPPAVAGKTVVVSEAFSPGWSASGGVALQRHHDLLISFEAPPGGGRVVLRYRAPGLAAGTAVSGIALVLAVAFALTPRVSPPR
jgi:hypothetical protein